MSRVYVTEGGYFNEYGQFYGTGIIAVEKSSKFSVQYPIRRGCYRHEVRKDDLDFAITYKSSFSNRGYRVTAIDAY